MPVDAKYLKMIRTIYPSHSRGQQISSRCDLAMKRIFPPVLSSVSCDVTQNMTDFAILFNGAVVWKEISMLLNPVKARGTCKRISKLS